MVDKLFSELLNLTIRELISKNDRGFLRVDDDGNIIMPRKGENYNDVGFKMTVDRFAKKYGLTHSQLSALINATRSPTEQYLSSLINAIESELSVRIETDEYFMTSKTVANYYKKVIETLLQYGAYDKIIKLTRSDLISDIEIMLEGNNNRTTNNRPNILFERSLINQARHFLGRDKIVDDILDTVIHKNKSVYLWGIGGIGKSEVVKSVINKIIAIPSNESGISDIMLINYKNQGVDSLKEEITETVLKKLAINHFNIDYEKIMLLLSNIGNGLLFVIDNIEQLDEEFETIISSYIPKARFIFSGRVHSEEFNRENFIPFELLPLSDQDGFTLFCNYYYNTTQHSSPHLDISANEKSDILKILDLIDYHTVTIELIAKLAKKQEKTIKEFLQILIDCGLNFKFKGEKEESVAASSGKLAQKEDRIINQLALLFDTIHIHEEERNLLIKISSVPNLPFMFNEAKTWFSLDSRKNLLSLSNAGWINRTETENNKTVFYIHSIIAAAVRAQHKNILYSICKPFILKLTDALCRLYESQKSTKLLIQFSWSITDIFQDEFTSIDDIRFLYILSEIYMKIGYLAKAEYLNDMIERKIIL